MELTPETLRSVEFRTEMRGYHRMDVDRFLEDVARVLAELEQQGEALARKAARAEQEASGSKELEETMRKTLLLAQQTADKVVKEARSEAQSLSGDAEDRATRINALAEDKARATIADAEQRAEDAYREARLRLAAEVEQLDAQRRGLVLDLDRLSDHVATQREALRQTVAGLHQVFQDPEFLVVETVSSPSTSPEPTPVGSEATSPPAESAEEPPEPAAPPASQMTGQVAGEDTENEPESQPELELETAAVDRA